MVIELPIRDGNKVQIASSDGSENPEMSVIELPIRDGNTHRDLKDGNRSKPVIELPIRDEAQAAYFVESLPSICRSLLLNFL